MLVSLLAGRGRDGSSVEVSTASSLSDVPLGQQGCNQRWIIKPSYPPELTPPCQSYEVMGRWVLIGSESCWGCQTTYENSQDRDRHLLLLTWNRRRTDSDRTSLDAIMTEIKAATFNKHVPTHVRADLNNGAIFSRGQQLVIHGGSQNQHLAMLPSTGTRGMNDFLLKDSLQIAKISPVLS